MIRKATKKDIPKIGDLLEQVDLVHLNGRPDLFKIGKKYNDSQVLELIDDENSPILVWVDSGDNVWGYCFCCIQYTKGNSVLADVKTLYIDDLCVDKSKRGLGIGKELYQSAKALAKDLGCSNLTLNVWEFEGSAKGFYERLGLKTQKTVMEEIL
jgi:ribosomal protein S18 acetylase RimI-like enzyme